MTKKILLILLLSTKMYGCARFLTEQWEQDNRRESEQRSGRMDWWAPQNEAEQKSKVLISEEDHRWLLEARAESDRKRKLKNAECSEVKATVAASDSLNQTTMNKLLHLTAAAGKLQAVQYLISKGAPVNARDEDTWTPLMKATKGNHLAVIRELLDAGADIDAYSDYCRICDAAIYGDYPPNWQGPTERRTPSPHKCRQATTAPLIAKFARNAEIENLFAEYKSRDKKN